MSIRISHIDQNDLGQVLELNEASVPHVNSIGSKQMIWFIDHAAFAKKATIDKRFAGFLIGLRPGTTYHSANYRWFSANYEDFAYVDRVAVSEHARRHGIAESLYDAFAKSQADAPYMTCEVNTRPPNEGSMRFHRRLGFRRVGTLDSDHGDKQVALLEKKL